jgi:hypothetical protein
MDRPIWVFTVSHISYVYVQIEIKYIHMYIWLTVNTPKTADGSGEDGARAARMDEWVVWGAEERVAPKG